MTSTQTGTQTGTQTPEQMRDRLEEILENDPALLGLEIALHDIEPGRVTMSLPVTAGMVNRHDYCHGGYLFLLADSALAYCCATAGSTVVTRAAEVRFLAPVRSGQTVLATATRRLWQGRNQYIEVILEVDGAQVAYFTGQGTRPPQR